MIDPRHEVVKRTALITWEVFDREGSGVFASATGRPATQPRLVAGALYLQHACRLSDADVVARWVETPCCQHLTGEAVFQHRPPIDASSLTRWRNRIGEEGEEGLLTQTIAAGRKSGALDDTSLKRVVVDTIVLEFKGTVGLVGPRKPRRTPSLLPPTPGFTNGHGCRLSSWRKRPGRSCISPRPVWHPVWRCRSAAMPMPNRSAASARH